MWGGCALSVSLPSCYKCGWVGGWMDEEDEAVRHGAFRPNRCCGCGAELVETTSSLCSVWRVGGWVGGVGVCFLEEALCHDDSSARRPISTTSPP